VNLLSVLEQNPSCDWHDLLGQVEVKADLGGSQDFAVEDVEPGLLGPAKGNNDEFTTFKV
jgi:hypothetical protein